MNDSQESNKSFDFLGPGLFCQLRPSLQEIVSEAFDEIGLPNPKCNGKQLLVGEVVWKTEGDRHESQSKGGSTYPLFMPLGFRGFQATLYALFFCSFWGEGYEHQQAFWVHMS